MIFAQILDTSIYINISLAHSRNLILLSLTMFLGKEVVIIKVQSVVDRVIEIHYCLGVASLVLWK
jgi:hypothetical protein